MKLPALLLSLAFAVAVCAPPPAAAEPAKVVLRDFTQNGFDYGYAAWDGLKVQSKTAGGVRIQGPANGGAGVSLFQLADLSDCKKLVLKAKLGPGMTSSSLVINLIAPDGTRASWVVEKSSLSDKDFAEVTFDLAKPTTPSDKPLNLEEIKNVQVQGTFTPGQDVDVELASLAAVP